MKKKIFELVESGSFGKKHNLFFDYFISGLIVLNVLAIAIESLPGISAHELEILKIFQHVSLILFTIEFLLRIYVADLKYPGLGKTEAVLKFIFSPLGLIDLFAILPFYLPFIFPFDLRFIRLFRLLRFVWFFKITRYNKSLNLIISVVRERKSELGVTFFIAFIILVVASFLMFFIENKAQPEVFSNIFASFWWAVSTLTTVGYGDIYPITPLGKTLSTVISILGIGVIALPTGIISSGFIEKINHSRKAKIKCPHCNHEFDLNHIKHE